MSKLKIDLKDKAELEVLKLMKSALQSRKIEELDALIRAVENDLITESDYKEGYTNVSKVLFQIKKAIFGGALEAKFKQAVQNNKDVSSSSSSSSNNNNNVVVEQEVITSVTAESLVADITKLIKGEELTEKSSYTLKDLYDSVGQIEEYKNGEMRLMEGAVDRIISFVKGHKMDFTTSAYATLQLLCKVAKVGTTDHIQALLDSGLDPLIPAVSVDGNSQHSGFFWMVGGATKENIKHLVSKFPALLTQKYPEGCDGPKAALDQNNPGLFDKLKEQYGNAKDAEEVVAPVVAVSASSSSSSSAPVETKTTFDFSGSVNLAYDADGQIAQSGKLKIIIDKIVSENLDLNQEKQSSVIDLINITLKRGSTSDIDTLLKHGANPLKPVEKISSGLFSSCGLKKENVVYLIKKFPAIWTAINENYETYFREVETLLHNSEPPFTAEELAGDFVDVKVAGDNTDN